jgi:hypothetical protein
MTGPGSRTRRSPTRRTRRAADVMRAERLRARLAAPPAAVEAGQRDLSRYDALLAGEVA